MANAVKKEAGETIRELAAHNREVLQGSMHEIQDRIKNRSAEMVDESMQLVKKYPLTTALGAATVGCIVGLFLGRRR